jgi:hypothetical protein
VPLGLQGRDAPPRNWSENGPTKAPGQRYRAAVGGTEVADFQGLGNAAEWSRTITGVSTHKALNLKPGRMTERKSAFRAKSDPTATG